MQVYSLDKQSAKRLLEFDESVFFVNNSWWSMAFVLSEAMYHINPGVPCPLFSNLSKLPLI